MDEKVLNLLKKIAAKHGASLFIIVLKVEL